MTVWYLTKPVEFNILDFNSNSLYAHLPIIFITSLVKPRTNPIYYFCVILRHSKISGIILNFKSSSSLRCGTQLLADCIQVSFGNKLKLEFLPRNSKPSTSIKSGICNFDFDFEIGSVNECKARDIKITRPVVKLHSHNLELERALGFR